MFGQRAESPGQGDNETVSYPCMNTRCTYRHTATGIQFKETWRFHCPECGRETFLDPDDLEYLIRSALAVRTRDSAAA